MASFGPALRLRREERSVSLDDVARETRLSKRYLTALEDEAIGKLPGGTYNRSYLKTYATFLGLDAAALLREYLAEEERRSAVEQDLLITMNQAIDRRNRFMSVGGGWPTVARLALPATLAVLVIAGVTSLAWHARAVPGGMIETVAEDSDSSPLASTTPSAPPDAPPVSVATIGTGPTAASHLVVTGSGVGTAVVDRELVGQAERFSAGSRVVFWTKVVGGRSGDTIDHVWFRDGQVVGAASLNLGSPDGRTQSRLVLDPPGDWVVEARDADGTLLARHEFRTAD